MTTQPTTQPTQDPLAPACLTCPWRLTNHGKRHPDGWYTAANRRRLWHGLRNGEAMSCHATDPNNPVSQRAQQQGYRPAPEHAQARECAGAAILQQREMQILSDVGGDIAAYLRLRRGGLTRRGIAVLVERFILGGILGVRAMLRTDLNADVGLGGDRLPWTERSADEPEAVAADG